jgi:MFS family permease
MGKVVLLAGLGINLCLGVLYTWSMFTSALTNKLGWTAAEALTPYAIALGMFGLTMVFAGRLQDKIGPRIAASIGGLLVGAGMIVASFAPKADATASATFATWKPVSDAATAALAKGASVPTSWTPAAEATRRRWSPRGTQTSPGVPGRSPSFRFELDTRPELRRK